MGFENERPRGSGEGPKALLSDDGSYRSLFTRDIGGFNGTLEDEFVEVDEPSERVDVDELDIVRGLSEIDELLELVEPIE